MKVTLIDGSVKNFAESKTVKEIASEIAISLGKATIGAKLDGVMIPSDFVVTSDCNLELITNKSQEFELFLNNTAAFITSTAISQLFDAKIATTFYNNEEQEWTTTFAVDPRIKLEQLTQIQTQVDKLIKLSTITSTKMSLAEAQQLFKENEYQLFLATKSFERNDYVLVYSLDGFQTVGLNPIINDLKNLKVIEIQQLTGSYWLDDSNNIMLQRVHGLTAISLASLEEKKAYLEERRSKDHRNINKSLHVFGFDNLIGAGLPLWMPNGVVIKDQIKTYLKEKEWEYDYIQVQTPMIGTVDLYKTSGHWDHYKDDMFQPFSGPTGSNEEFMLRPMNCPHHVAIYKQTQKSYRDLPFRIAEHATQHRYESSGSLTGLERVRAMELTDSHIFVRNDQVEQEFKAIYKLIAEVLNTFEIEIDYLSFSVRDPKDKQKYYDNDEMWTRAEAELEKVLIDLNLTYKKMVGEAAFYGPKLDIQIKTAQNHEITVSTIQLDFLLPEKFDITYIGANQELLRPIMIHRGLIGTYERFIATLLEQRKGVLPLWLAPIQIQIIPLGSEDNFEYGANLKNLFKKDFIRSNLDLRDERLSYKIRDAQIKKIPYQLVIGDKERQEDLVTYRMYGSEVQTTISSQEFLTMINSKIKSKK